MAMVAMSTWYARQRAKSTAIRKIMGCPRLEIYTHTLASFLSASLIAAVIAIPVIYIYTGRWLQTYSYRIDNHWWMCTCWPCSSWVWSQPSPSHTGPCS